MDRNGSEETVAGETVKQSKRFSDFVTSLARYRTPVIGLTVGLGLFFFILTFVMPQKYASTATLLPPEKSGASGLMSFLTGSSAALDLVKGQDNPQLDMFKNILESRVTSEQIATDSRVRKYFSKWDTSFKAASGMSKETLSSEALRNGMMTVTVEIPTPWFASSAEKDSAKQLSAYMANKYVMELDKFNRERLMTTAKNTRIFIEGEYKNRMAQLDSAYARLEQFQQENKAISLTDQLASTVTAAAMLSGQVQELQMQLGVEQRDLNPNSTRIETIRAQLEEAQTALKKYDEGGVGEYVIALDKVPALARTLANYTREVKLLEQISAFLRQQLETEKINEQKDLPSLQILDSAIPPEKRSSPNRILMLVLGTVLGFVIAAVYATAQSYKTRVRTEPERHQHVIGFLNAIKRGKQPMNLEPAAGPGPSRPKEVRMPVSKAE